MQIYNGPSRRVLRKIKEDTDSGFTIDGVRSQEEERAIYVRQSFTLKQYEDRAAVNALPPIDAQWTYPEEKDEFSHHVGNDPANAKLPTPFTAKHVLTDRLLLNKSFKDVYFQPDNAHNFLKVSNLEAAQMAPLLCSKKQFENVTIAPKVTGLTPYEVQDTVLAPLNMYGKYWFGTLHDMAGVANRTGKAPYFMTDMAAAVGAGNLDKFSAYGFAPKQMTIHQDVRPRTTTHEPLHDHSGYIEFAYDSSVDVYRSKPINVTIPWPLNRGEFTRPTAPAAPGPLNAIAVNQGTIETTTQHRTFTIPSIVTEATDYVNVRPDTEVTPYNYFKIRYGDYGDNFVTGPRIPLSAAAEIQGVDAIRHEFQNSVDVIPVRLAYGSAKIITGHDGANAPTYPAAGNPGAEESEQDIYMFIPIFRICKGNKFASNARPRRFATDTAAVVAQAWKGNNTSLHTDVGMSTLVGAGDDLASQVPFWAYYESTKWAKQHVSTDVWQNIINEAAIRDSSFASMATSTFENDGAYMWDMVKVGYFDVQNNTTHRPLFSVHFDYDKISAYPDIKAQIDVLKNAVVDNRVDGGGAMIAHNKVLVFAYRNKQAGDTQNAFSTNESKGYFFLRFDQCNTFRDGNGLFEGETYPDVNNLHPFVNVGMHHYMRHALWNPPDGGAIQIEFNPEWGGFTLNPTVSPFRNEALYTKASRLPVGAAENVAIRNAALAHAETTPDNYESGKPLDQRSVFNFLSQENALIPLRQRVAVAGLQNGEAGYVTNLPQAQANGFLNQGVWNEIRYHNMELFLPVRRPVQNHFPGAKEVTVECVEPFFGYCTGTSQLQCQHPLDTHKHGKNFPMTIQDYKYTYYRDGSPLVNLLSGYIKDPWAKLEITSNESPEFTCISEKLAGLDQRNKEVLDIQEITPTLDTFSTQYSPGESALVELETRYGMFEYLFLYVKYVRITGDVQSPEHNPVITKLKFMVRGRENLFVSVLDQYDIERISRKNCHALCDWRALHDHGQGVLIHLSDIGLTEEIPFPQKKRIQLDITLVEDTTELSDIRAISNDVRTFNVVVVRQNQRLDGNDLGCRFSFLNES